MTRIPVIVCAVIAALTALTVAPHLKAYAYDRTAAAQYADQWWDAFNPAYPTFGDDCTNFVSQALNRGGETMVGLNGSNTDDHNWYVTTNTGGGIVWTHSWTVASDLENFLINDSSRGTFVTLAYGYYGSSTDNVNIGDTLFYNWGQGQGISHAAIQVAQSGSDQYSSPAMQGDLADQHTNARYHIIWNLSSKNAYWATTTVYEVHIN